MKSNWIAVTATLLIGAAGQASAQGAVAGPGSATGAVLVNQHGHYRPLKPGTRLRAGDRLIALDGGASDIVYPDGCRVAVGSGSLIRISDTSPCRGGVKPALVRLQGAENAPADTPCGADPCGGSFWTDPGTWDVVAGAGLIAVIVLIATEHNGPAVSP